MPKIKTVTLDDAARAALEKAARYGRTPSYRLRCEAVLLKSQALPSAEVARRLGCCEVSVNAWRDRYLADGLPGLKTRGGRGRKPILTEEADLEAVRRAVRENRQRLSLAKAELEAEMGRGFSLLTLRRFLKKTADATSASGGG